MTNSISQLMTLFILAEQGAPLAEKLLYPGERAWMAGSLMENADLLAPHLQDPEARYQATVNTLASLILARIAFCERSLQTAVMLGAKQYVVLKAGFDLSCHREGNWRRNLETFLVDTPEMLDERAERFTQCGEGLRKFVYHIPAELSGSAAALENDPRFDKEKVTFCSLLETADSLSLQELEALISSLSPLFPLGSCIVMDYSAFSAAAAETLFDRCGFHVYEHLDKTAMEQQFFAAEAEKDPAQRLSAPDGMRYLLAVKR